MSGSGPERDLIAEEEARLRRSGLERRERPGRGRMDDGTRRLALTAGGLGAALIVVVGGWTLLGHHSRGVPVLGPPPGPVRVKPTDPGGMQLMSASMTPSALDNGTTTLAPPPEQANPELLQERLAAARRAEQQEATESGTAAATPSPPPPRPNPAPNQAIAAPSPPAAMPKPAPVTASSPSATAPGAAGEHSVQLAALDSAAAANAEWQKLSRAVPDLLGDHRPVVVAADKDGKRFFRLRTGGFASTAEAIQFCTALRGKGIACTLADF